MSIVINCGDQHVVAEGDTVRLKPIEGRCFITAPLTASMPLRGEIAFNGAGSYLCKRKDLDLICTPN